MTYAIKVKGTVPISHLRSLLEKEIEGSRFAVQRIKLIEATKRSRKYKGGHLTLHRIRLKESKPYCGNHPGPCLLKGKGHKKRRYLEGLDWVEFNDLINDVLDRLLIEADVTSSQCSIRVGHKRRVYYRKERVVLDKVNEFYVWAKDGLAKDYQDWCGKKAPSSKYPKGTPGLRTNLRAA